MKIYLHDTDKGTKMEIGEGLARHLISWVNSTEEATNKIMTDVQDGFCYSIPHGMIQGVRD